MQETGAEQWQWLFPLHSACRPGLNAGGKPVFLNPAAALRQVRAGCSGAVRRLRQEQKLPQPFRLTVQDCGNPGWQPTGGAEDFCTRGRQRSAFADVRENGFA